MSDVIPKFVTHLRAAGASKDTARVRRGYLERFERVARMPIEAASTADLEAFLAGQCWKLETRRSARAAFSKFFTWLQATDQREDNPAQALPKVKQAPPLPHPANEEDIRSALARSDKRIRLMIRLAAEAGLRRAEVARVHANDFVEDLAGWSLIVHGKGTKDRLVPLNDDLARIARFTCLANGGWAFPGNDNGHLSPEWVGKLVRGALPKGVSMHALRHRFATRAYGKTSDLLAVQQLLGHASPETTQRYVVIDGERLRRVALAAA